MTISFARKAKEFAPVGSLKYDLHKYRSGYETARPLKKVHASELTKPEGMCPRYYALHDATGEKPKDKWLSFSENLTFQIGRDVQDQVVWDFAGMGKAIGHWRCLGCNQLHEFCKAPKQCVKCGCRALKPEEVRFESLISGASCGIDMLAAGYDPKLMVTEIKTIAPEQFKSLVAPLSEHRLRTNMYLRIIAESGGTWKDLVKTDTAKILYVSKGGYGCADPELGKWGLSDQYSPVKEYVVKRDDFQTDALLKRAGVVKAYRDKLVSMPCGICTTANVKRAQFCSMRAKCFSGDYPPGFQWQET